MANGILACDNSAVCKAGRDVMCKVTHDSGENGGSRFIDTADDGKEIDGCFEGTREESGSGKEEVADGCKLKVEG